MTNQKDEISLRRFKWLLRQRGYQFWDENSLEKKIQVRSRRPDFYVETPWCDFIAEVKSFEKPSVLRKINNRVGVLGPEEFEKLIRRISNPCQKAAAQLAPYADLGLPMIIVFDNWQQVGIPLTPLFLIQFFFGVFELRARYNLEKGIVEQIGLIHSERNKQLKQDFRSYVSAVVVPIPQVRYENDDFTVERPMNVRVLRNPFAAVPWPDKIFCDEGDIIF